VQTQYVKREWGLLGLTLLAFALRVYSLGRWELWFDETASYVVAVKNIPDLLAYTRTAIQEHPPGYYLLLHFWMQQVGSSEFALRYLSVLAGVVFVPLIYRFAGRLFSPAVGFWAAFVAAISPFAVSYAQEARMYTLLGLLALLSVYVFWVMLHEKAWRWWFIYIALAIAGMLTHYLFALLIVAQNVFVLLLWPRLSSRRKRWLVLQGGLALAVALWILIAPATVRSLLSLTGMPARQLGGKVEKVLLDFALGELRGNPTVSVMRLAALVSWTFALGGLALSWRGPQRQTTRQRWVLISVTLAVPFLAGVPVIPVVIGRYFYVAFPAFCVAIALGLSILSRRSRPALILAIGGLSVVSAYGLYYQYTADKGVFGQPMTMIEAEYQPGEAIILAHPHLWPLATYYARNIDLPRFYVPDKPYRVSEAEIRARVGEILAKYNSIWFGPVLPAHTDPEIVERTLNELAFQSEKQWFAKSTFVAHYFRAVPLERTEMQPTVWGGRIALRRFEHSSLSVRAGDAIRLRFWWQRVAPISERYLVGITLTDQQGHTWARRASEPCGAFCLTTDWGPGLVEDRHALMIPTDTPPGRYDLRLTWYTVATGTPLRAEDESGKDRGTSIQLATVTVTPPRRSATPPRPPHPLAVTFENGFVLRGYDMPDGPLRPDETVPLELYWFVRGRAEANPQLTLTLTSEGGQVQSTMTTTLAPPSTRPSGWPVDSAVRTHTEVTVPPTARAGRWQVWLSLKAEGGGAIPALWERPLLILGRMGVWNRSVVGEKVPLQSIRVVERKHNFALPPMENRLSAVLGSQVELLGFDLSCGQPTICTLRPGASFRLTLVWRARGPTDRRYKVFTHLLGPQGKLWGQQDAEPAQGAAPTVTWVAGEVVSDTHTITLEPEAPAGTYRLLVGMYHEASGRRLPAFLDGSRMPNDALPLATVHVRGGE